MDRGTCNWCLSEDNEVAEVYMCLDCMAEAKGRIENQPTKPERPMSLFGKLMLLLWSLFLMAAATFWSLYHTGILDTVAGL